MVVSPPHCFQCCFLRCFSIWSGKKLFPVKAWCTQEGYKCITLAVGVQEGILFCHYFFRSRSQGVTAAVSLFVLSTLALFLLCSWSALALLSPYSRPALVLLSLCSCSVHALHVQLCWSIEDCIHLQKSFQPIYIVTFSSNFYCVVCLIVAFICLLCELCALRELPWVTMLMC